MGKTHITVSEWYVLDCLWELSPQSVMELVAELHDRVGWAKSTTITTLRRMEEKELLAVQMVGKGKRYSPAIDQGEAVVAETESFLQRVYRGSVSLMMSSMAERQQLSKEEIRQLRAILDEAEKGGEL